MTVRTMYDSTTPQNIPTDAQIAAFYPHAWGTDVSHLTGAMLVRIDNRGDHADDCHALDVEGGAATIMTAHEWVQSWHALHPEGMTTQHGFIRKPIIYISEAGVEGLRTALAGMDYDLWVAWWDVGPTEVVGAFAHQYINHGPNGENYDISVVTDGTWGKEIVTPTPTPPPPPVPPHQVTVDRAVLVFYVVATGAYGSRDVESTDGGVNWR